jgi:hypothetical protein
MIKCKVKITGTDSIELSHIPFSLMSTGEDDVLNSVAVGIGSSATMVVVVRDEKSFVDKTPSKISDALSQFVMLMASLVFLGVNTLAK